jgi:drug/metabolite transporter (DMT)-like permease
LGYAGVFVLMAEGLNHATAPIKAYLALFISPMAWAAGSIVSRRNPLQCSPVMGAAIQTLTAGVLMGVIGLILGEAPRYRWSAQAGWSVAYLVVAGSLIGYLCYYWLISQVTPALLGTYAYVNPAVAVWLGWWLADEQLSLWQWAGTGVILAGVVLVTLGVRRTKRL